MAKGKNKQKSTGKKAPGSNLKEKRAAKAAKRREKKIVGDNL